MVQRSFCHLILSTNTTAHQRKLFGGQLEPSKILTTSFKHARQRGKIVPIWSAGELVKTTVFTLREFLTLRFVLSLIVRRW